VNRSLRLVLVALTIALLPLVLPNRAQAQTLFSNFGPGTAFNPSNSWPVDSTQAIAAPVTPSVSGIANRIEIAAHHFFGPSSYRLTVFSNAGGVPSTTVLVNVTLTNVLTTLTTVATIDLPTPLALSSGTTYWVGLFPNAPNAQGTWNGNSIGQNGFAFAPNPGNPVWSTFSGMTPALRVSNVAAAAAPEPTSLVLLLPICAGLFAGRAGKRGEM
jgi:hypothetical protein